MMTETLTYNRMPLNSISEIDQCVGKTYEGDFLIRYDASRWVNINHLYESMTEFDTRLFTVENTALIHNELKSLRDENYELQQRLDKLEMLLGEN